MGLWRLVAEPRDPQDCALSARGSAVQSRLVGLHLPARGLHPRHVCARRASRGSACSASSAERSQCVWRSSGLSWRCRTLQGAWSTTPLRRPLSQWAPTPARGLKRTSDEDRRPRAPRARDLRRGPRPERRGSRRRAGASPRARARSAAPRGRLRCAAPSRKGRRCRRDARPRPRDRAGRPRSPRDSARPSAGAASIA